MVEEKGEFWLALLRFTGYDLEKTERWIDNFTREEIAYAIITRKKDNEQASKDR